jgi:hypothetical protein
MSSNLFAAFKRLVPDPPLFYGEVVDATPGAVIVEMPDGGRMRVLGAATFGQHVFVRAGSILAEAAPKPVHVISL